MAVQLDGAPELTGEVQVTVPPAGGLATDVTVRGFWANAAVTVQLAVTGVVLNVPGVAVDAAPQPPVVNTKLLKVYPLLAAAMQVELPPTVLNGVQVTVPPVVGLATPVTVGNVKTLAKAAG